MAILLDPNEVVFLDTSYAIALSAPSDQFHLAAERLADQIVATKAKLVTTRAVLLEIGNALARLRHRAAGIELLQAIESDATIAIRPLTEDLFARALKL